MLGSAGLPSDVAWAGGGDSGGLEHVIILVWKERAPADTLHCFHASLSCVGLQQAVTAIPANRDGVAGEACDKFVKI